LVRETGLEPARSYQLEPKSSDLLTTQKLTGQLRTLYFFSAFFHERLACYVKLKYSLIVRKRILVICAAFCAALFYYMESPGYL